MEIKKKKIVFDKKFSEKHIDNFISDFYQYYKINPLDLYLFNFIKTEWISNQGLLLITALFKYLLLTDTQFEVKFIERGTSVQSVSRRKALQIVQIWEVWKIWKILPDFQLAEKYFGLTNSYVDSLKDIYEINYFRTDIYNNYDITPFVDLEYLKEYDEDIILDCLDYYHNLNDATIDILSKNNCDQPFVNKLFGEIISKELYENFLCHFGKTFFKSKEDYAFFSVTLKGDINTEINSKTRIEEVLEDNFLTEELKESESFFKTENEFVNKAYISYSFLDFGEGIVNTLRKEYLNNNNNNNNGNDSDILKYAFKHNTSRNPIKNVFENDQLIDYIPRGLFDVLIIVKRYHGLLISRSGYGKVLFDFSKTQNIEESISTFGNNELYFPGTFITIYLPALKNDNEISSSAIVPTYETPNYAKKSTKLVNINDLISKINKDKENRYNLLFNEIHSLINTKDKTIIYFSFDSINGSQLAKKIIFYLITSYDVNYKNNFVIFNPPQKEFLDQINHEILVLSETNKKYKIHPLPFVFWNSNSDDISLYWLGIYNKHDIDKLSSILYEVFSLSQHDFLDKDNIVGHILSYDQFGNVVSNLPNRSTLIKITSLFPIIQEVRETIKLNCFSTKPNSIYYCNGNYYQFEYIELIKLLYNNEESVKISNLLFNLINIVIDSDELNDYKYIAITSSSHIILNSWIESGHIISKNVILLDNYNDVSILNAKLSGNCKKYILVCDIIATGYLTERIEKILIANACELDRIAVIVNTVDPDFAKSNEFNLNYSNKIISICNYPLKRYLRNSEEIQPLLQHKEIIRINPYTNIPITLSASKTNLHSIILNKDEFLRYIEDRHIFVGLLRFNNILHPYFFDTENIIKEKGIDLFERIFSTAKIKITQSQDLSIFYPKKSDIRHLNFSVFKTRVQYFKHVFELERHNTDEGWKFPHTTDYFSDLVKDKSVLILDDGSCTGDSLTQMINEISYFLPDKITVICLIGRLWEHRREFLSQIDKIKRENKIIDVDIYFGTHWNIPTYYSEENPFEKESNRLNQIINIQNTPSRIKKIALSINRELNPRIGISQNKDYKFLPKFKIIKDQRIPKKDLIRVRDEIGKVVNLRFYKESFIFFDDFMKKYESNIRVDRYKDIELLCATISYEPQLYKLIKLTLPDIVEKLKEFIQTIIWGNPQKKSLKLQIKNLTYNWDGRDFIHLLFIFFDENELIEKLKYDEYFSKFLVYLDENSVPFDYFLYKLLSYFPINKEEIEFKKSNYILPFLDTTVRTIIEGDSKLEKQFNIFRSFVSTLPINNDFDSQLFTIRASFAKLIDEQNHKTSVVAQLGYMLTDINLANSDYKLFNKRIFIDSWKNISAFIEPILSFANTQPTFFPKNCYDQIYRLSQIHGSLNELVISLNKDSNFVIIEETLDELQNDIISIDSPLFCLLSNPITNNFTYSILQKKESNNLDDSECEIRNDISSAYSKLYFPDYYFSEIILETIFNNFRHCDKNKGAIKINIKYNDEDNTYIDIDIENHIGSNQKTGSNRGSILLDRANNFPNNIFNYSSKKNDKIFYQKLKIKKY